MRIVCAGMRRSGSTWLYNLVRLALNAKGCFEDNWRISVPANVVKTHKFSPIFLFGADKVVLSHRDLRDVAASAVRRRLIESTPAATVRYLLRALLDEYQTWVPFAAYDMNFERMMADKAAEAQAIFAALGIDAVPEVVCGLVEHLPVATKETDQEILLAPNHFTGGAIGGYVDTLPVKTTKAIESVFGDWLKQKGYMR